MLSAKNPSKKHQIFEKLDEFENRPSCKDVVKDLAKTFIIFTAINIIILVLKGFMVFFKLPQQSNIKMGYRPATKKSQLSLLFPSTFSDHRLSLGDLRTGRHKVGPGLHHGLGHGLPMVLSTPQLATSNQAKDHETQILSIRYYYLDVSQTEKVFSFWLYALVCVS